MRLCMCESSIKSGRGTSGKRGGTPQKLGVGFVTFFFFIIRGGEPFQRYILSTFPITDQFVCKDLKNDPDVLLIQIPVHIKA